MLFSYKTTYKVATRYSPYQLVYGLNPLMPTKYIVLIVGGNDKDSILMRVLTSRIIKLEKLQKVIIQAAETTKI